MNLAILGDDVIGDRECLEERIWEALTRIFSVYDNVKRCYITSDGEFDSIVGKAIKRIKPFLLDCKIVYTATKEGERYDKDLFDEVEYLHTDSSLKEYDKILRNEHIVSKSDILISYLPNRYYMTPTLRACGAAWALNKSIYLMELCGNACINFKK